MVEAADRRVKHLIRVETDKANEPLSPQGARERQDQETRERSQSQLSTQLNGALLPSSSESPPRPQRKALVERVHELERELAEEKQRAIDMMLAKRSLETATTSAQDELASAAQQQAKDKDEDRLLEELYSRNFGMTQELKEMRIEFRELQKRNTVLVQVDKKARDAVNEARNFEVCSGLVCWVRCVMLSS